MCRGPEGTPPAGLSLVGHFRGFQPTFWLFPEVAGEPPGVRTAKLEVRLHKTPSVCSVVPEGVSSRVTGTRRS